MIIRAISVLEGIALVANPNFAIVDESFPYVAKLMLTADKSPRLQESLHYMVRMRAVFSITVWVPALGFCPRQADAAHFGMHCHEHAPARSYAAMP